MATTYQPRSSDWSISVACPSCKWQGKIADCKDIVANLVRCPQCGYPVKKADEVKK